MVHKCCVPTCKGNYKNGPKVSVFGFPSDPDLRKQWVIHIKRVNFEPTKNSKVCELHFLPHEIIRESETHDPKTGRIIKAPLSYPKLKNGAIPSQFPNGPIYLSSSGAARESPCKRRFRTEMKNIEKAIEISKKSKLDYDTKRTFKNLGELRTCLSKETLSNTWTMVCYDSKIIIANLILEPSPAIQKSLIIDNELNVSAFIGKIILSKINKFVLPLKINNINVLLQLLKNLECMLSDNINDDDLPYYIEMVNELLNKIKHLKSDKESEIAFLSEQISKLNINKIQYRHSPELLVFCCLLFSISPHAYRFLYGSGNIIIPHSGSLKRLCSKLYTNPYKEQFDEHFLEYVKLKYLDLKEKEKIIILMIDEIHLKPYFDFKGGNFCGMSFNSKDAATSAYVFMIRSLLSPFQDVAHILPVRTINADNLYFYLKKIIIGLEDIGFRVTAVVSDNNSINKKAMSKFVIPNAVKIVYNHPTDSSRPLFFVIDPVHILKCVRNNWLNQKNDDKSMYYPNFENFSQIKSASFITLKKFHEIEATKLTKYGYGLTLKALYPSNLERQNVKLALQVFNICVAEGLLIIGKEHNLANFQETSEYIKIICTWWSIINVKTTFKGFHKQDILQEPLTIQPDDEKIKFLYKFIHWLDTWEKIIQSNGKLSNETHFALGHSTHALLEMAHYCINELKFDYFLPGKIQTDLLENRFGKYRQLAGSQYNISIRQVYETETKLRLHSLLPKIIKSDKYGSITINLDDKNCAETESSSYKNFSSEIYVEESDFLQIENNIQILTYIAGYCCYNVVKKLNCDACKSNLTVQKELAVNEASNNWIKTFDRGLLYPHPTVLNIVIYNYIIIQKLVSKAYEKEFLNKENQRIIACNITINALKKDLFVLDLDGCSNEHDTEKVQNMIIRSSTNVFLNNYCKKKNEELFSLKRTVKNQKLQTLKNK